MRTSAAFGPRPAPAGAAEAATLEPKCVVGIDGGATHTRYLLADATGSTLATGEGRGTLLGAGEDEAVADSIVVEVGALAKRAGVDLPVGALCAGLAGAAGRVAARMSLEGRLRAGVARRVSVVADAEVAFVDAFGDGDGILMIAGTGSVALGRSEGGELRRVGGWGALFGDEGSGYRVGLDGLHAAIRGVEDRGPATKLSEVLFQAIGIGSLSAAVLEWGEHAGKAGIAALAPAVVAAAEQEDPVANEIVGRAVEGLLYHVKALASRLGLERAPQVALVGGLLEEGGPLRTRFESRLAEAGFQSLGRPVQPARGAVRLALEL